MQVSQRTRKKSGASRNRGERRVPFSAIRKLAQEIAEKFRPEKIILFGSYAYGKPHRDSDVDLLVIMPAWNEISKACRITCAIDRPFPLDILVRTPENLRWRLEEGDWFLREAVGKGKVLYEKANRPMGSQSRSRFHSRKSTRQV
jgi:predicted nucleotidyltransferase